MKRLLSLIVWAGLLLPAAAQERVAEEPGEVSTAETIPARPMRGDKMTILYRPGQRVRLMASREGEEVIMRAGVDTPVSLLTYVYDTMYRWRVYELPMRRAGDTAWAADWMLPSDAGFVAYAVQTTAGIDNFSDRGHFTMVGSEKAQFEAGAEAGYGLLRSPSYGLGVPVYFREFSISDTATYMWLSNEIIRHHNAAMKLVLPYVRAKLQYQGDAGRPEVARAVAYLLGLNEPALAGLPSDGGGAEEPLVKAYLVCSRFLRDSTRADSIRKVVLDRWPHGALARLEAYTAAVKAANTEERLHLAEAFVRAYPYHSEEEMMDHILGIDYYKVFRNLLSISIAQQRPGVVGEYGLLPFYSIAESYYKAVEIPYEDWKTMDAQHAFGLSDTLYRMMLTYCVHQPASMWYYSPRQWTELTEQTFSRYFELHAKILMELGKNEEALALAQRAQRVFQLRSTELDQTEAILLERAGRTDELDSLLRVCVRLNQMTARMISMLRESWMKMHGGSGGSRGSGHSHGSRDPDKEFDDWMASLKDARTMALMRAEILKDRLDMAAPAFSLRDAAGRMVSLKSLKGKTVVLDFWATWCAPCKAGMAGMHMAVQQYKKDTNVVFLFIDTQERDKEYKSKGLAFMKEKGYAFRVLYDQGPAMDELYKVYASAMHTSGIPFKAVIDPAGRLRFANIGFKGSPSGLADEISMMIELARGVVAGGGAASAAGDVFRSDSIVYENRAGGVRLGGTVSYPVGSSHGLRTAVVLLSGTGKQDRDGTMAGHKMFALLADSLTRRGYVVLRSDDRGTGVSTGIYDSATTADFASDALAAVRYLRSRKDLAVGRVGLLGHSEGGMAAAIAASQDTGIAFVISLSSPGLRGLDALLLQNKKIVADAPIPPVNKMRFDSINNLLFHIVYANRGHSDLEVKMRSAYAQWKVWDDSVVAANKLEYGGHFFFPFESYLRQAKGRWYQYFIGYDPAEVLAHVHAPYLAINGDKDLISDGAVNLSGIASALAAGGNKRVRTWLVPGLNHLYQHCHTCDVQEYANLPETMAPEVVTTIGDWVEGLFCL